MYYENNNKVNKIIRHRCERTLAAIKQPDNCYSLIVSVGYNYRCKNLIALVLVGFASRQVYNLNGD